MSKAGLRRRELGVGLRTFQRRARPIAGISGSRMPMPQQRSQSSSCEAWGDNKNRGANVNIVGGTARKGRCGRGADE
jgi:hypothetical protein